MLLLPSPGLGHDSSGPHSNAHVLRNNELGYAIDLHSSLPGSIPKLPRASVLFYPQLLRVGAVC